MTKGLFWFCVLCGCVCASYFTFRTRKNDTIMAVRAVDDVGNATNSPSPSASIEGRLAALERMQGAGLAKWAQESGTQDVTAPAADTISPEARKAAHKEHFKLLFGHLDRVRGSEAVDPVWQTEMRATLSEAVMEAGPAATAFSAPEVACGKTLCRLQLDYDHGEPSVREGISAFVRALGNKPTVGGGSFFNDEERHRVVGYLARVGEGLPFPQ